MTAISIEAITKRYGNLIVLPAITARVEAGQSLGLWGPTGCGKTTLLRIIAGSATPDGGTLSLNGQPASKLDLTERRVGMVFQDLALWPHMSVRRHLDYVLRSSVRNRVHRNELVLQWIERLRISDIAEHRPGQMSRGQRQRLAIARACCTSPRVLLMDEPASSQDSSMVQLIVDLVLEQKRTGAACIIAAHDKCFLKSTCDRIASFQNGGVSIMTAEEFS